MDLSWTYKTALRLPDSMFVSQLNTVLRTRSFASTQSIALRATARIPGLAQTHLSARTMSTAPPEKKQRTEDYVLYYVRPPSILPLSRSERV